MTTNAPLRKDHDACGWFRHVENTFALSRSEVWAQMDNRPLRVVADGIGYANGILVDHDEGIVPVVDTIDKAIDVYQLTDLRADALAEPFHTIALPAGPDNPTWAADGRVLAATLPDLFVQGMY